MKGDTVIISGATKGLGRELMLAFAQASHPVIGLYATDDAAADSLRRDLQMFASMSLVLKHDVRKEDSAFWSLPEIEQAATLTLINNACAPFVPQPLHLLTWSDFESALGVALKGSWLCTCGVLRRMVRTGQGTIVNVLTRALPDTPPKGFAAYVAAKHALRGLTLSLAAEYGARGVRVFSVSPGFMSTALTDQWDSRLREGMLEGAPAHEPKEVAQRILNLVDGAPLLGRGEDYRV